MSLKRQVPRPFLKWAGGKGQLVGELTARCPRRYGRYFEPFLGGGALFFALRPKRATLSDFNQELIHCYRIVRDRVTELIEVLRQHPYEERHYYALRERDPAVLDPVEAAARTIYLNKTGYNGLYRVNQSGRFNVPFGRYAAPTICDAANLLACSAALADTDLAVRDFEAVEREADKGDMVYFDPPYAPVSATADFTAYQAGGFGEHEQERLARLFGRLASGGVRVLLSNSDVPLVRRLYGTFRVDTVRASRAINSNAAKRGKVSEIIVSSAKAKRPVAKAAS